MALPEQVGRAMGRWIDAPWNRNDRRKVRLRPKIHRQHLKRQGVRLMRRLARRLFDDAPTKLRFFGYED